MNSKQLLFLLSFVFLLPVFVSCGEEKLPVERLSFIAKDGSTVELAAEIARTSEEQATGLMWRTELEDGHGMLFWYAVDTRMHFWMKNTLIPLSIAFLDSSGTIREIYNMEPESRTTVSSSISMRYALEVPEGWFWRVNLAPGCTLTAESLALLKSMSRP